MNSTSIKTCITVFSLAIMSVAAENQQTTPDLVLFSGKIFTSNSAHPYVQALAINGERIVATGDSAKIKALAGSNSGQVDLGGRTVIPGINLPTITCAFLRAIASTWNSGVPIRRGRKWNPSTRLKS